MYNKIIIAKPLHNQRFGEFSCFLSFLITTKFGSVVAHPDLDGEVSESSPCHTKDLKKNIILIAPQPVLVIMSLSTGNALVSSL